MNVFPGFAASEVLYNEDGSIKGIATGDMGVSAEGEQKSTFTPGYEIHAKYTMFAEGCRGHLGKQIMEKFNLRADCDTHTTALDLKKSGTSILRNMCRAKSCTPWDGLWGTSRDKPGWILSLSSGKQQVAVGLIVDLGYSNPHLSPFDEFQRFKQHKIIPSS